MNLCHRIFIVTCPLVVPVLHLGLLKSNELPLEIYFNAIALAGVFFTVGFFVRIASRSSWSNLSPYYVCLFFPTVLYVLLGITVLNKLLSK